MATETINTTIALVATICQEVEAKLQGHFEKVDANKENKDTLYAAGLADEVSKNAGIKAAECLNLIYVYLRARPELEIRRGGGIYRTSDVQVEKALMTPKECALKHYELVKEHSVDVIAAKFAADEENAKQSGKATRLKLEDICGEITDKLGLKNYTVYFCVRQYITAERPDLRIELGRYGGVVKVDG